jgi:hypothetical protein
MSLKKSLPVMRYGAEIFKNCSSIFSETVKDKVMKFSGMIDLLIGICNWGLSMSTVTTGRHRKWKNKSKFSKIIFQIKTYTKLLGLFSSVKNNWRAQQVEVSTSGFLKKKFQILNFQCRTSSLLLKCFTWN